MPDRLLIRQAPPICCFWRGSVGRRRTSCRRQPAGPGTPATAAPSRESLARIRASTVRPGVRIASTAPRRGSGSFCEICTSKKRPLAGRARTGAGAIPRRPRREASLPWKRPTMAEIRKSHYAGRQVGNAGASGDSRADRLPLTPKTNASCAKLRGRCPFSEELAGRLGSFPLAGATGCRNAIRCEAPRKLKFHGRRLGNGQDSPPVIAAMPERSDI